MVGAHNPYREHDHFLSRLARGLRLCRRRIRSVHQGGDRRTARLAVMPATRQRWPRVRRSARPIEPALSDVSAIGGDRVQ